MATTRCVFACPFMAAELMPLRLGASDCAWVCRSHLAVCCKACLPILCMGHVRVVTNNQERERQLLQATGCLTKQPGNVLHLEVSACTASARLETRHLVNLRCGMLWYASILALKMRERAPCFCCATAP